jgi:hypothetical protein
LGKLLQRRTTSKLRHNFTAAVAKLVRSMLENARSITDCKHLHCGGICLDPLSFYLPVNVNHIFHVLTYFDPLLQIVLRTMSALGAGVPGRQALRSESGRAGFPG